MIKLVPTVNVVIVKDNKILLSKRQNKKLGQWYVCFTWWAR